MTIQVLVIGLAGSGKTHLMRKMEALLRVEGYGGMVDYGQSGEPVYLEGTPRVVVSEIQGALGCLQRREVQS